MLSTIESNRIAMGDSVHLSSAFYERMALQEEGGLKAGERSEGMMKIRGMAPHLLTLLHKYGAYNYQNYHRKKDGSLGLLPKTLVFYGATYTPQEFGHSVTMPGDYEFYGADYAFPDRRPTDSIKQTSPEKMLELVKSSINKGRAVCWEGDISEDGFEWHNGVADMPYSKENYCEDIKDGDTTDDHCMEICGIAHEKTTGKQYFLCKNSWGKSNRYGGYMFMSFDYFLAKTVLVGVFVAE